MKWSKVTHVGLVRSVNEDFLSVRPDLGLFAVADGMGGHQAGEVASKKAIECLEESFASNPCRENDPGAALRDAIVKANALIYELGHRVAEYKGMGTTVTVCCLNEMIMNVAHVGDSRCYLIRNAHISRLTEDHSLVQEMVQQHKITTGEAMNHPYRNVLTRALGTSPQVEVDLIRCNLDPDDLVIICSDGVTKNLSDEEILKITQDKKTEAAANTILDEALARGGNDNITLVIVAPGEK
ncbi:MAG: Stp1/IreP family PP2C-type Ser/Thr phosphatase [Firmicutes bacterium]|nr:Stp1/IreP family PP2C-type Ser/Thr phosphatase [Bacillota bacterium]